MLRCAGGGGAALALGGGRVAAIDEDANDDDEDADADAAETTDIAAGQFSSSVYPVADDDDDDADADEDEDACMDAAIGGASDGRWRRSESCSSARALPSITADSTSSLRDTWERESRGWAEVQGKGIS